MVLKFSGYDHIISLIFLARKHLRALSDITALDHQDYHQDFRSDNSPINNLFELNISLDFYDQ